MKDGLELWLLRKEDILANNRIIKLTARTGRTASDGNSGIT